MFTECLVRQQSLSNNNLITNRFDLAGSPKCSSNTHYSCLLYMYIYTHNMMCYTYYHYCYYYRKPISYNNNKIPCCETRCQNTVYTPSIVQRYASVYLCACMMWGGPLAYRYRPRLMAQYRNIILSLLVVDGGGDLLRTSGGGTIRIFKNTIPSPPPPWHRHKEAYLTHTHTHTRSVITIIHDQPDVTYL